MKEELMPSIRTILTLSAALAALSGCYYPVYTPAPAHYDYAPPPGGPMPDNGGDCHPYTQTSVIEGKNQQVHGQACRQPDGSWRDSGSGAPVDTSSVYMATLPMPMVVLLPPPHAS